MARRRPLLIPDAPLSPVDQFQVLTYVPCDEFAFGYRILEPTLTDTLVVRTKARTGARIDGGTGDGR
jgi:hypothetical protein